MAKMNDFDISKIELLNNKISTDIKSNTYSLELVCERRSPSVDPHGEGLFPRKGYFLQTGDELVDTESRTRYGMWDWVDIRDPTNNEHTIMHWDEKQESDGPQFGTRLVNLSGKLNRKDYLPTYFINEARGNMLPNVEWYFRPLPVDELNSQGYEIVLRVLRDISSFDELLANYGQNLLHFQ